MMAIEGTRLTTLGPGFGVLLLLPLLAGSCAGTAQVVKTNAVVAIQAQEQPDPDLLMDIGISPLDPGIPEEEGEVEKQLIIPDVRRAESRFIAYHLKDTLEQTGNWGAVRVVPQESSAIDLHMTGRIDLSDGEQLKAHIRVVDSTGREWVDRHYKDSASKFSYRDGRKQDPFQDFYNSVANDLLAAREELSEDDLRNIRRISAVRYAISVSPDAFGGYLTESGGGRYTLAQLPSTNDPMMSRVDKIKDREYTFIDTMDDYYAKFYRDMELPYHDWRQYTYEEAIKLRETSRDATKRLFGGAALVAAGIWAGSKSPTYAGQTAAAGTVMGGIGAIRTGLDKRKQAEMHAEALKELSASLGSEITPIVLDIEGRTIELTGSVNEQYAKWRAIIKEIYAEETGLPVRQEETD